MKTKGTAAVLALLLGGIGGHKFYLGQSVQGLLYLFFCWTFIPAFIALIEFFAYLLMSENEFNRRYNLAAMAVLPQGNQMGQNVTINLGADQLPGAPRRNLTAELRDLKDLHIAGALTDDEFQAQKTRLLTE